jgi:hypothetical protein
LNDKHLPATGDETVRQVDKGFGLLLFSAAVIVIAVGVVRLWIHRSQTEKRAS